MNVTKKKFTNDEDEKLIKLVNKYGAKKWNSIALSMEGRTGRQCRDRYKNYLAPFINKSEWTLEEDMLLVEKFREYGPCWSKISKFFVGRTSSSLKNRWYFKITPDYAVACKKRKRIESQRQAELQAKKIQEQQIQQQQQKSTAEEVINKTNMSVGTVTDQIVDEIFDSLEESEIVWF